MSVSESDFEKVKDLDDLIQFINKKGELCD